MIALIYLGVWVAAVLITGVVYPDVIEVIRWVMPEIEDWLVVIRSNPLIFGIYGLLACTAAAGTRDLWRNTYCARLPSIAAGLGIMGTMVAILQAADTGDYSLGRLLSAVLTTLVGITINVAYEFGFRARDQQEESHG